MQRTRARFGLLLGALTLVGASAGLATSAASASGEPVEIDWWHIQINEPDVSNWQAMADAYMAENPNVTINITVMENEAYKAALQTNVQAGDVPDLFQSWGGGVLRDQVEAGAVQDITEASAEYLDALSPGAAGLFNIDGVQYGLPYNQSIVGMWYNKTLFAEAGIDAPPATWAELLEDVQTAEGRRHHADRRRRRRQVAGPLLVLVPDGPPRRCRGDEPDRRRQQLQRPRRRRGR